MLTNLKLLRNAKNGDIEAELLLVEEFLPLIKQIAAGFSPIGIEKDDLIQEGMIGLFGAVRGFSESSTATFKTYASRCIKNAMLTALKKASRKKHLPLNSSVELTQREPTLSTEQIAVDNEQYIAIVDKINTMLSKKEKQVLIYFIDGYSYEEIAKEARISQKSVSNALHRLRKKLQ